MLDAYVSITFVINEPCALNVLPSINDHFSGLFVDVFNNYPFGTTSFIYLINARFILFLRKLFYTPNTFIIILRDFTLFSFFVEISQLLLFSIIDK